MIRKSLVTIFLICIAIEAEDRKIDIGADLGISNPVITALNPSISMYWNKALGYHEISFEYHDYTSDQTGDEIVYYYRPFKNTFYGLSYSYCIKVFTLPIHFGPTISLLRYHYSKATPEMSQNGYNTYLDEEGIFGGGFKIAFLSNKLFGNRLRLKIQNRFLLGLLTVDRDNHEQGLGLTIGKLNTLSVGLVFSR